MKRTLPFLLALLAASLAAAPLTWENKPVQTAATAETQRLAGPLALTHATGSIASFTVADGAASPDLLITGGATEDKPCGLAKSGPGSLRIEGPFGLTGMLTVYEGTLDLSAAVISKPLRANLFGSAKIIPPTSGLTFAELYLNGDKQPPGPRSDPARFGGAATVLDSAPSRRDTWLNLKYGIFSHYVWNGYGMTAGLPNADGSRAKSIDELADRFDVPNYVAQLKQAGVQYVVFTAWHSGTCPLFPSAAMAKWAPGRPSCPKRDLLGDLLDACRAAGIRGFFYAHPYQPVANPHNDWINDLFAELVDRYGERLDGLWIDENFQDCTQDKVVDYPRLLRTLKERNPDLVLTHNNGGSQTYGVDAGVQEVQWEWNEGRMVSTYQIFRQTAKSADDMIITTVIQAAANHLGGGIQWSIDAHGPGGGKPGGLDEHDRPILDPFVQKFLPIADSVRNTRPSSSYPPPFSGAVVRLANLSWGVATQSSDGAKEFLHVLKPPARNTLRLPPPADGKRFGNARLLDTGKPVTLTQSARGLTLTLPEGETWRKPNTVIALDVLCPGGAGLVNNTSLSVRYQGGSWIRLKDRNLGEFQNDVHAATANGDSATFTFSGTDVAFLSLRDPEQAEVEIHLDGVSQGTFKLSQGGPEGPFQTLFAKSGLPRGNHTLKLTKTGGLVLKLDAFRVSDLINNSDPEPQFLATTWLPPSAAKLEGPWEGRAGRLINGHTFKLTFEGTGVELHAGAEWGWGVMALELDGKPHSSVRLNQGVHGPVARIIGLPLGSHTLSGRYTERAPSGFISSLSGYSVARPDFWKPVSARGLGELRDDVHLSLRHGSTGRLTFTGSGIEVIATRGHAARTAHYTLDGEGSNLWVGLSHHFPVSLPGTATLSLPHLFPGTYTLGFTNASNPRGLGFDSVPLEIDAFRVHKGQSLSAHPLQWGARGQGGSGVWEINSGNAWNDGLDSLAWEDFGGRDYAAIFGGSPGTVTLKPGVRVNRIALTTSGYQLTGEPLRFTGNEPLLQLAPDVRATVSSPLDGSNGLTLGGSGTLTVEGVATLTGGFRVKGGALLVGPQGTLGSGDLTLEDATSAEIRNPAGAIADSATLHLKGKARLRLGAGVTEKVSRLTLDGVSQPAGKLNASTQRFLSGDGSLVVETGP